MELKRRSVAGRIYWVVKTGLGLIGLIVVCATRCAALGRNLLFHDNLLHTVSSPDGFYRAELINTEGDVYHQNRYRVCVHARRSVRPWLIYKTKTTEDAAPTIDWINSETLVLGLPCGIIGHAANPDDWERSNPNERRHRVRSDIRRNVASQRPEPSRRWSESLHLPRAP